MWFQNTFIRNIDAGDLLEDFLISAVTSVLVIRFYLHFTGYPQIGGRSFHVAHLLFGGFFMLFAIVLLIAYLNRPIMHFSAILGGVGFGTFIDELGKFITKDNNYFYQPTAAFIYMIFIVLFLVFRFFDHNKKLTRKEYLINALERMEDVVLQDLNAEEKKKTLRMLSRCDPNDPIVIALKGVLKKSEVLPDNESKFDEIQTLAAKAYRGIIHNKYFRDGIIMFFIGKSVIMLYSLTGFVVGLIQHPTRLYMLPRFAFVEWGELVSSIAAGFFVLLGALVIYRSRLVAYQMFRRSTLISIFLTQFFLFYQEQFSAVIGLVFNIIILVTLQYMIYQEKLTQKEED